MSLRLQRPLCSHPKQPCAEHELPLTPRAACRQLSAPVTSPYCAVPACYCACACTNWQQQLCWRHRWCALLLFCESRGDSKSGLSCQQ